MLYKNIVSQRITEALNLRHQQLYSRFIPIVYPFISLQYANSWKSGDCPIRTQFPFSEAQNFWNTLVKLNLDHNINTVLIIVAGLHDNYFPRYTNFVFLVIIHISSVH